jgi:kynureninase
MSDATSRERAEALDRDDPLSRFRERFYVQPGTMYMDGNSLGLLSYDAEDAVASVMHEWKSLGIDGWLRGNPAWFYLGEELGSRQAALFGAHADEVVVAGTTTVNLHALVATFYEPRPGRRKIVATELDFPSDIYALQAHIQLHGGDPASDLVRVQSRDGRLIEEDDIVAAMTDDVALVVLPSVLYRSGQLLDMERLTREAHAREIAIGFDCAHSAGVIPHQFHDWGVDFALWCNYKYLNSGPGSVGGLFVHSKHFNRKPALPGWWGYQKERQFDMLHDFEPASGAGAWQISTINVLSAAPIIGALRIVEEAGLEHIRTKSLALTDYLIELIETGGLTTDEYGYGIGTPRDHGRRGGHVAVEHPHGPQIARALKQRGVVPDFRPPNVVRLAPVPLYTSFTDVWDTVAHLRAIIETGEYRTLNESREVVA